MKKSNKKLISKEQKIKMLIEYAKKCYKKGHKPSKREIRRKFHMEIYNYFKNIADYYEKAGIEVSLQHYPKEKAKRIIVDYVREKAKINIFPTYTELRKRFNISMRTYFRNLRHVYESAKIEYSLVEEVIKEKIFASSTHSKNMINSQRKLIRKMIKENVEKEVYPGVRDIQTKLNLKFYNLYDNIFDAYKDAKTNYERPSPIILGKKKEEIFTKIIKELFIKMDYKILRISIQSKKDFNRYADMTIQDNQGNRYLIEIKAYRKDCCITKREFQQLLRYLEKEKITNGILITTSNTKKCNFENISLINATSLINLMKKYQMNKHLKSIEWIQNEKVNLKEKIKQKEMMKKKILNFIKNSKNIPSKKELETTFRIDIRTYFGKPNPYEKIKKEIY